MSPCGSRSSAGSSGRSSSRGNPRTRCAQRQGSPTPHGKEHTEISSFAWKPHLQVRRCLLSRMKELRGSFICISKLVSAGNFLFFFYLAISISVRKWLAATAVSLKT